MRHENEVAAYLDDVLHDGYSLEIVRRFGNELLVVDPDTNRVFRIEVYPEDDSFVRDPHQS